MLTHTLRGAITHILYSYSKDGFNPDTLFASWDEDHDESLTVVEICRGLQRSTAAEPALSPVMQARMNHAISTMKKDNLNPEWQYFDAAAFRSLLFTPVPQEENPDTRTAFVREFSAPGFLETILPKDILATPPQEPQPKNAAGAGKSSKPQTKMPKERLERVFDSWDADGDGSLAMAEIQDALSKGVGLPEGAEDSASAASVARLTKGELESIQEYMVTAEASGENLDWQYLDLKEFSEIVQAGGESL